MDKESQIKAALAHSWVFDKNGHKWSNNNNEAGDNYGSFIAGYEAAEKKMSKKTSVFIPVPVSRELPEGSGDYFCLCSGSPYDSHRFEPGKICFPTCVTHWLKEVVLNEKEVNDVG